MKKRYILVSLILVGISMQIFAKRNASQIVRSVLKKLSPGQWSGKYAFTNFRVDGSTHKYTLKILAKDSKTIFINFLKPKRESGRQLLNKDGEIWTYLPDSRKVIRLSDRESIGNGDFNNADVLRLNWLDDYSSKIVKESSRQYIVDLRAKKNSKATYSLIRLWVRKKNMQPIQQYFYDEGGHHLKSLLYRQIRVFHGLKRPKQLIMENMITGQRTLLVVKEFKKVYNLPISRFRQNNLGK